jgi:hypothetical protein
MATTLGASVIIIGLIEGLAEATALILKVFTTPAVGAMANSGLLSAPRP